MTTHRQPTRPTHAEPTQAEMRILATVRRIPRGRVATYGQVAEAAGFPGRARLVGRVLGQSPLADGVPWHRVVNAAGRISARGDGEREQRKRLEGEGVRFSNTGRINLNTCLWAPKRRRRDAGIRNS